MFLGHPVRREGDAARDRLADDQQVGLEPPRGSAAAGPGAERVRLVDDEEDAVLAGDLADRLGVALLGQHDAECLSGPVESARGA